MPEDNPDQISLPGGETNPIEEGEGLAGTSGLGQGRLQAVTLSPIIVHSLNTEEPEFFFFMVEWGPDDNNDDNILREAIPGEKVSGDDEYVSFPYKINECIRGEWYRFRVATVNKYGWRSATLPIPGAGPDADDPANYWVYQRAGFDEDDLSRMDEATNILPNSDFEFDQLEDASWELPYWQYWTGSAWGTCKDGVGPIVKGTFGRLTPYHLILETGKVRSAIVDMYPDRPYALSGFFVQDNNGAANLTFRMAYYDADDNFLDHDYVLMGEDGLRGINGASWVGGGIFETRDRYGTVFFPPDNVAYGRVEIINDGAADIWCDDLMVSQTNKVTRYVSWDRESLEAYEDTWQYRRDIPPDGTVSYGGLTPIQAYANEDASMDLKLRWNYAEGNRYTSGFMMFCNIASSGVYSPTPTINDYDFAYKLASSGAKKFDLMGINPVNRYSFAIAPYATTRGGTSYGTFSHYDNGGIDDWIDFQGAATVSFGGSPRTQVNIISENDTEIVLEFDVTGAGGEATTTYYRLTASGSFTQVTDVGGTQLTVQKSGRDVTVYYYSQGDDSGVKESVLEFVIDRNRTPRIVDVRSEFEVSTQSGIVYWYGDDDVQRVDWDVDGGPTYITSGQSGNTGWFAIPAGQSKDVTMLPRGRGHAGTQVIATVLNPAQRPRVELKITERRQTEIDIEYEAEGFGDTTVNVYSKKNLGAFSLVTGSPPSETVTRDNTEVYLTYYGSGTTTGLLSEIQVFTVDYDRKAEISDTSIEYDYNAGEYAIRWWGDDDTDSVDYRVNGGTWYLVSGQSGATTPQSIVGGQTDDVALVPYGPAGSGVAVHVYPTLPPQASSLLPPYIVISGAANGSDGGGAYVLVDVYSFNASGQASGNIQYAEGSAVWTNAGVSNYQHKVYRPTVGEQFSRYRSFIGQLYSDTVVFSIDQDDIPEIRPDIDLSDDQTTVRIEWQGDDDVGSVQIIPSGVAARNYNLQAGVDEVTEIDYGETKNFTIQPFDTAGATGKEGKLWPLRITRPLSDAPWIAISKQAENTASIPATVTLQFDAQAGATGVYWSDDGVAYPGGAGWTSIANGGTQVFNRPEGDQSLVVKGYAANGTVYSTVSTFTIDQDEVPTVTSAYYDPDWPNDEAELYWSIDDDTDYVQLYLNGAAAGAPIASSTTNTTITGMTPDTVKTYTIVPKRGNAEFPQNAKTVVISRSSATVIPTIQVQLGQTGSTGELDLVINDPGNFLTATSFHPVSGGIGAPNDSPTLWDNYDATGVNLGDTVLLVGGHTSVIYWAVAYDLNDGNGVAWITGSHTFDVDVIPHVGFSATKIGDDVYLSWTGDEDTASIRTSVSYTSMPTATDLNTGTYTNGRVGYVKITNDDFEPDTVCYVRSRGYSATNGTGTKQEIDFQTILKFDQDVVPTVKVIAEQTSGSGPSSAGTGSLVLQLNDPHGVVSGTAFEAWENAHDQNLDNNPANWSNFDGTPSYNLSETVDIGKKHTAVIHWGVRFTISPANYWITGSHTFDPDTQAEITSIGVSYNTSNNVVATIMGDEDCDDIYIRVGINNSNPTNPTNLSNDGVLTSNTGTITTSVSASMGDEVTVKAVGYNFDAVPGPVKKHTFRRGDSGNQAYHAKFTPSQTGSTGTWQVDASDPTGVITNMRNRTKSGTSAWSAWGISWDGSTGSYGDATVMRNKDVTLGSKHTSNVEIEVTYDDADGTSRTKVDGHTFDADFIAEVTHCSVSWDSSNNIVVTAVGDEDCDSLHFRVSGTGGTPGTPDGSGSDDGSISARSGVDTTSVTCAPGATTVVKIRGKNGAAELGPTVTVTAKRESGAPGLTSASCDVEDNGTNNIYTASWSVNAAVTDGVHYIDVDYYEDGVKVGGTSSTAPSTGTKVWTDSGAGDGNADEMHHAIIYLRGSSGILQSITTRAFIAQL